MTKGEMDALVDMEWNKFASQIRREITELIDENGFDVGRRKGSVDTRDVPPHHRDGQPGGKAGFFWLNGTCLILGYVRARYLSDCPLTINH